MKKTFILIIISLSTFKIYAQDRITVAISPNSTFIETYNKSYSSDEYSLDEAYRLGPNSLKTLKDGVKTALKWVELNQIHNKTFQKEVCRFKVMQKESFKFHGYVDQFTTEMAMIFNGEPDGIFKIGIRAYDGFTPFTTFTDINMLQGFKKLLDGKSANNEIDDIFKK